jgi:hypothetical protein
MARPALVILPNRWLFSPLFVLCFDMDAIFRQSQCASNSSDAAHKQAQGTWADGPYLLLGHNASLPSRCIKTNREDPVFVKETATRLHVRLLGMALFGPLAGSLLPDVEPVFKCVFLVLVIGTVAGCGLLCPRVRLEIPVCREIAARRRLMLISGWTLFGLGMAAETIGLLQPPGQVQALQGCLLLTFLFVGAGVTALYFTSLVGVHVVDGSHAWLTGFGHHYLAGLPQTPPIARPEPLLD